MSSQNIANLTVQDLLNIVNNNKQVPQPASSALASASVTATIHELSFYNLSPEVTTLPILKQSARSKLQSILGLKNQKERWLRYLFKKKAPDFPPSMADWAIKDLLIKHIQRSRYFKAKQKNKKKGQVNNSNEDIVISDIEETEEIDGNYNGNYGLNKLVVESENHDSEIDDDGGNQRFVNKIIN
ncbi:hypothetical protein GLOIN_2v1789884 [Rhizophagus clarus]|uniref:Uncharacterized protein n=1 Tax=Rhizophagus clarus TaxID=94130 RepID=A0A8H3MLN0_9GLOM|nr:hypothetical protein GLOIN_2v1789884 [Rhizophagus clarus]